MKKRILSIAFLVILLGFAIKFGLTFPWKDMFRTLLNASLMWVLISSVTNVLSTNAKAQGWSLLMGWRARPYRWLAQEASLIGAAAGSVAISVGGEAVRVRWLTSRSVIKTVTAVRALVASRITEAIGLALMILLGTAILPPSSWVRLCAIFAAALLLLALGLWWWGRKHKHAPWPRGRIARALAEARMVLHQPGVLPAIAFGVLNWVLQWISFGTAVVAVIGYCPVGLPLAVLILANIGGALKLTLANVGVLTAAALMVARPFHVSAPAAFAGSIVMQATQTLPAIIVGGLLVLVQRKRKATAA